MSGSLDSRSKRRSLGCEALIVDCPQTGSRWWESVFDAAPRPHTRLLCGGRAAIRDNRQVFVMTGWLVNRHEPRALHCAGFDRREFPDQVAGASLWRRATAVCPPSLRLPWYWPTHIASLLDDWAARRRIKASSAALCGVDRGTAPETSCTILFGGVP